MLIISILLILGILMCLIYPLVLWFEFRNNWIISCQIYPHITLFPIIFSWVILIIFYHLLLLQNDLIYVVKQTIPFFAITYLALQIDLKSNDFIMLFEIKDNAEVQIPLYKITGIIERSEFIENISSYLQESSQLILDRKQNPSEILIKKTDIYITLDKLLNHKTIDKRQKKNYQKWIKFLLSYELWKTEPKSFSYSRMMYGLSFYFIVSTGLNTIILLAFSVFSPLKLVQYYYTAGIGMIYICWVPLRMQGYFILKSDKTWCKSNCDFLFA